MSLFKRQSAPTVRVIYKSSTGQVREVSVPADSSVMEVAVSNGIDGIVAECGGSCMCATCHVYVDEKFFERLPPIAEGEEEMLGTTAAERRPNSRLSCQIQLTPELDGLTVTTPEKQQ